MANYGENLGAKNYYDDDRDYNQVAAPAYAQQNNYDIEMDRYRAQSQVSSYSHGAGSGANNGAVFLDDVPNNEFNADKQLPSMNNWDGANHNYYRSQSVRDIDSPREEWAANPNAPDPTKGIQPIYLHNI